MLSGEIYVEEIGKEKYPVKKGEIHIMPPFTKHMRTAAKGDELIYYGIHFDLLTHDQFDDFSVYSEYILPINNKEKFIKINSDLAKRQQEELSDFTLPHVVRINNFQETNLILKNF